MRVFRAGEGAVAFSAWLGRADQRSRRTGWWGVSQAFHLGIAEGDDGTHSQRNDLRKDVRWQSLQRLAHAERHQGALVAIGWRLLIRTTRHVAGHVHGASHVHGVSHIHVAGDARGGRAAIRHSRQTRGKRGGEQASYQKDRENPRQHHRSFHQPGLSWPERHEKTPAMTLTSALATF